MEGQKRKGLTVAFRALTACSLVKPSAITMVIASSGGAEPVGVVLGLALGGVKGLEKSKKAFDNKI